MNSWGESPTVRVPLGLRVGGPDGGYEVLRMVASGAWGSVFAGRPLSTGPATTDHVRGACSGEGGEYGEVALKFLPTGTTTPRFTQLLSETLRREVESRAALRHPRLVHFIEVLTVDDPSVAELDGAAVLVMELAAGSLAGLLDRYPAGLPPSQAAARLTEIVEALAYMHRAGWVHGDLKPSNVLLRRDGTCCLTDFGLAGLLEGTHAYVPPLATPDYAPPERREAVATVDGQQVRASGDIWAFGMIACRMLAGSMPLPGETGWARAQAAVEYVNGDRALALPDDLAEPWRRLIEDCLAPDPATRPDAATVLRRITDLDVGQTTGCGAQEITGLDGGSASGRSKASSSIGGRRQWALLTLAALAGLVPVGWVVLGPHVGARPAVGASPPAVGTSAGVPASSPGPAPGTCQARPKKVTDVDVSHNSWPEVWYCANDVPAVVYADVDGRTPVASLLTPTSWFLCYYRGSGGNVWYYTQGDEPTSGWETRNSWGFVRAAAVHVAHHPYPGVPSCQTSGWPR
jgi:serine/threonine protein kinase